MLGQRQWTGLDPLTSACLLLKAAETPKVSLGREEPLCWNGFGLTAGGINALKDSKPTPPPRGGHAETANERCISGALGAKSPLIDG